MAPMIAYTLPTMQLVCNLVMPEVPSSNAVNRTQLLMSNETETEEGSVVEAIETGRDQFFETSTSRRDPEKLPEGYIAITEFGVAYKLYEESVSWLVALNRCHKEDAGLWVIDSLNKTQALERDVEFIGTRHVGIVRLDGKWVNANTGSPVSTDLPWEIDHPANASDCVTFFSGFGLSDVACSLKCRYICERPLPGN